MQGQISRRKIKNDVRSLLKEVDFFLEVERMHLTTNPSSATQCSMILSHLDQTSNANQSRHSLTWYP